MTLTLVQPTSKEIPLCNCDFMAIVDLEDYDYFNEWEWHCWRDRKTYVIGRCEKNRNIFLRREVVARHEGTNFYHVKHLNGNVFDNRYANLRSTGIYNSSRCEKGLAYVITPSQQKVIDLVVTGLSNQKIADALFLSKRTVETHLQDVYAALNCRNRVELVNRINNLNKTMTITPKPNLDMGIYRHYKGKEYTVWDVAKHSETGEWMVLYGECGSLWVRPFDNFASDVEVDGRWIPRFQIVESSNGDRIFGELSADDLEPDNRSDAYVAARLEKLREQP